MTYRLGHHSTSDDSSRYRGTSEVIYLHSGYEWLPMIWFIHHSHPPFSNVVIVFLIPFPTPLLISIVGWRMEGQAQSNFKVFFICKILFIIISYTIYITSSSNSVFSFSFFFFFFFFFFSFLFIFSLRLYNYLNNQNWWTEDEEKKFKTDTRKEILDAFKRAEGQKKPSIEELWTDVYDTPTPILLDQKRELEEHLAKYPTNYPLDQHEARA